MPLFDRYSEKYVTSFQPAAETGGAGVIVEPSLSSHQKGSLVYLRSGDADAHGCWLTREEAQQVCDGLALILKDAPKPSRREVLGLEVGDLIQTLNGFDTVYVVCEGGDSGTIRVRSVFSENSAPFSTAFTAKFKKAKL